MNVAVVGASGIVGREFIKLLCQRGFPLGRLYLFSGERSAGKSIYINGEEKEFIRLSKKSIPDDVDIAFFSAGSSISKRFAPLFVEKGACVIDNSSCFRMDIKVPLVVPEINFKAIGRKDKIIANPNCSTIQLVLVLNDLLPLRPKNVYVSTYQSVSGAGLKALEDALLEKCDFFKEGITNNVIPQIGDINRYGESTEEEKLSKETVKILGKDLKINATAVRVPTLFSHCESVVVEFERKVTAGEIKSLLEENDVVVYDENMISPLMVAGSDITFVSRLHQKQGQTNSINFWITADNIRTGAALNAIKIAERMIDENK